MMRDVGSFVQVDTVASTILVEMTVQSSHSNSTQIGSKPFESEQEGVSEISPSMYEHWLLIVSL